MQPFLYSVTYKAGTRETEPTGADGGTVKLSVVSRILSGGGGVPTGEPLSESVK